MKFLIWGLTAVTALLGTLLVVMLASAAGWLGDNMGGGADWVKQLSQLPVPAWLSLFLGPAATDWLRVMSTSAVQALATRAALAGTHVRLDCASVVGGVADCFDLFGQLGQWLALSGRPQAST